MTNTVHTHKGQIITFPNGGVRVVTHDDCPRYAEDGSYCETCGDTEQVQRKARKGDFVILRDGDTFRVTRATPAGDVYGENPDGTPFGPYDTTEYRVLV